MSLVCLCRSIGSDIFVDILFKRSVGGEKVVCVACFAQYTHVCTPIRSIIGLCKPRGLSVMQ